MIKGKEFRKWRRAREISQQEVAEVVGKSTSWICQWETKGLGATAIFLANIEKFMQDYDNKEE